MCYLVSFLHFQLIRAFLWPAPRALGGSAVLPRIAAAHARRAQLAGSVEHDGAINEKKSPWHVNYMSIVRAVKPPNMASGWPRLSRAPLAPGQSALARPLAGPTPPWDLPPPAPSTRAVVMPPKKCSRAVRGTGAHLVHLQKRAVASPPPCARAFYLLAGVLEA